MSTRAPAPQLAPGPPSFSGRTSKSKQKGAGHIPSQVPSNSPDHDLDDRLGDEDYPAYSMGHAAEILGVTQAFLRSLDAARLLTPGRSEGGHRRYSRYQLRLAARARELIDAGTALDSACRIIILEDQLAEARRINDTLRKQPPS